MNAKILNLLVCGMFLFTTACSSDDPDITDPGLPTVPGGSGSSSTPAEGQSDDLEDFDIEFDTTPLSENESIITDPNNEYYGDYIEYSNFKSTIDIIYASEEVTISPLPTGVTANIDGAHVVITSEAKGIEYNLSGNTENGSFKIYSEKKFKLGLNGVNLTNPNGAAINIQSGKTTFVVLGNDTFNSLTDGINYLTTEGEDMKACFFSEGQLIFSGNGSLSVTGNCKNGIGSDDYIRFRRGNVINVTSTVSNGVKANDAVFINGGVLNIDVSGVASKGISCNGDMGISGGRTTIITTGDGEYETNEADVAGCAGIKCDGYFTIDNGEIAVKSTGKGGKGINSDNDITINGGNITILTTGTRYIYSSQLRAAAKGIKSDANITINGGNLKIRTNGSDGSEGIESKQELTINEGLIEISSYDDALNAAKAINIKGGRIYAYSSDNDGIDSNGTIEISGGIIVASGSQEPERGIDCDHNSFAITGGTLVSIGGASSMPTSSKCTQPSIMYNQNLPVGSIISLLTSSNETILSYDLLRAYDSIAILLSSPKLIKGSSYILSTANDVTGGNDDFHGMTIGGSTQIADELASLTLSSMVSTFDSDTDK